MSVFFQIIYNICCQQIQIKNRTYYKIVLSLHHLSMWTCFFPRKKTMKMIWSWVYTVWPVGQNWIKRERYGIWRNASPRFVACTTLQCYVLAVLNCLLLLKHYLDFIVSSIWNPTVEISTDLLVVWGSDFLWVDLQDENRGELHVLWLLQQSTEGLLQAAQSPVSRAHQRTQGNILHHMVKLHVDLWYAQVVATWFCVMNTWADQQTNIK